MTSMPGKGQPEPQFPPWSAGTDLARRWVRLCIAWYVCGVLTGLFAAAWISRW